MQHSADIIGVSSTAET